MFYQKKAVGKYKELFVEIDSENTEKIYDENSKSFSYFALVDSDGNSVYYYDILNIGAGVWVDVIEGRVRFFTRAGKLAIDTSTNTLYADYSK